ncbi:hypothetical protein RQP46_008960 [Phenoliferia psychrophenolica]
MSVQHPLHDRLPSSSPLFLSTNRLLTAEAGSRLYGISTPSSDVDLKGIYLPSPRQLLLGSAPPLLSFSPTHPDGIRNSTDDTDATFTSVARFLQLLGDGQPDAVELALAPESAWVECGAEGRRLMERLNCSEGRTAWVTKEVARRMVGFAKHQVREHQKRSHRIAALEAVRDWLAGMLQGGSRKLKLGQATTWDLTNEWVAALATKEEFVVSATALGDDWRLAVVGKTLLSEQTIATNLDIVTKALAKYSTRSMDAKDNGGVDWKAMSHAVRLAYQGRELMKSGTLTFPRPQNEANFLRGIKLGEHPRDVVAAKLESALEQLADAMALSSCRDAADRDWLEQVVFDVHREAVGLGLGVIGRT